MYNCRILAATNWGVLSKETKQISKAYFAGVDDNSLEGFYIALNVIRNYFKGNISVKVIEEIMLTEELIGSLNRAEDKYTGTKTKLDEVGVRDIIENDLKVFIRYLAICSFKQENTYPLMTATINNFVAILLRAFITVNANKSRRIK